MSPGPRAPTDGGGRRDQRSRGVDYIYIYMYVY